VAVVDVGRAINPATVEGQIEGGMALGISVALHEEMVTENGKMVNTSFADYKLLSSLEAPLTRPIIRETPHPFGPFGARGCGEAPVIPTGAAIANAIANATGVRVLDYPITPEKVLKLLKS
jgi:CO/xanthine dehydrogenase Mo-binding subunit